MGKNLQGKEIGEGITQKENGRYLARYRSKSGKRPEKVFDKVNEAKRWLAERKYQEDHGNVIVSNKTTVNEWFWYWLENVYRPTIREKTYELTVSRYKSRIESLIGDLLIRDVRPVHCQTVINKTQEVDTSGSTFIVRRIMRLMFESAEENKMIARSPITKNVKIKKDIPKERRVLSASEQQQFVDYIIENDVTGKEIFLFILETGLRCSEAIGLKWENVDFEKQTVTIDHQTYKLPRKNFEDMPPKTYAGYRTIPLTQNALQILKDRRLHNRPKPEYDMYVFTNQNGNLRYKSNLDRVLRDVCKKMNIEHFSIHVLRHSFATRCIENGMRPKSLQKILGHHNIESTMNLYVHATDESIQEEMKKMEFSGRSVGGFGQNPPDKETSKTA